MALTRCGACLACKMGMPVFLCERQKDLEAGDCPNSACFEGVLTNGRPCPTCRGSGKAPAQARSSRRRP